MVFTGSRYPVMESFVTSVVGNDGNWAPIDSATFLFLPELQEELGDADNESLRMKQDVTKANGTENTLDAECITVTLQGQAMERSLQAQRYIHCDMPLRAIGRRLINHRQLRNYKHVQLRLCRTAHIHKPKPCIGLIGRGLAYVPLREEHRRHDNLPKEWRERQNRIDTVLRPMGTPVNARLPGKQSGRRLLVCHAGIRRVRACLAVLRPRAKRQQDGRQHKRRIF